MDCFPRDPARYRLVNAGAHRKPPPLVGAPALTLHFGLWHPDCADAEWRKAIDYFLYRMFRIFQQDPDFSGNLVTPNYDHQKNRLYLFRHFVPLLLTAPPPDADITNLTSIDFDRNTRYDVFSVRTAFHGVPLTVRAELYSEFWNLYFITDFDHVSPAAAQDESSVIFPYAKDFDDINTFVTSRYKYLSRIGGSATLHPPQDASPALDDARIREIRKTLHKRFRDIVSDYIIEPCLNACKEAGDLQVGTVFCEFHGAILGLFPDRDGIKSLSVGINNPAAPSSIPELVGAKSFSASEAPKITGAIWPIIKEVQRTDDSDELDEKRYGKPEFTVSRFQNGRSLYISSLGWLDPQPEALRTKPIIYTVLVAYRSRWSLGRLVERIHSLGTFRLAAMYDIEKITSAGDKLKNLQDELRTAESQLANAGTDIDGDYFAKECLLAGSNMNYGLMHRIERSQYYLKSFERHLESLRCRRVEGFQPYDQFVRRRMYGAFDYIRRVGDRYIELRHEIDLILQQNHVAGVSRIVAAIAISSEASRRASDEIARMATASDAVETQMKAILERLEDSAVETTLLLDSAEVIVAIPLVYYIGHILVTVIAEVMSVMATFGLFPQPNSKIEDSLAFDLNGYLFAIPQPNSKIEDNPLFELVGYVFAMAIALITIIVLRRRRIRKRAKLHAKKRN